jgi:hypothetical protein
LIYARVGSSNSMATNVRISFLRSIVVSPHKRLLESQAFCDRSFSMQFDWVSS